MSRLGKGMEGDRLNGIPMKRFGTVEEIGYAALFLSSPAASYITGDTLVVDGGSSFVRPPGIPKEVYEKLIKKPKNSKL